MLPDGTFQLVGDPAAAASKAQQLFAEVRARLLGILPPGAIIEHIGATAVPGCETKGDLDIVVRVNANAFESSRAELSKLYQTNVGSVETDSFAAFEDLNAALPLGSQLVVKGSEFDNFSAFRDRLIARPDLVQNYNELKRQFHGRPHDEYRLAKSEFIQAAMKSAK